MLGRQIGDRRGVGVPPAVFHLKMGGVVMSLPDYLSETHPAEHAFVLLQRTREKEGKEVPVLSLLGLTMRLLKESEDRNYALVQEVRQLEQRLGWKKSDLEKAEREIALLRGDREAIDREKYLVLEAGLKFLYKKCREHGVLGKVEDGSSVLVSTDNGTKELKLPDDLN